jgi:hypothetical protein
LGRQITKLDEQFSAVLTRGRAKGSWTYVTWPRSVEFFGTFAPSSHSIGAEDGLHKKFSSGFLARARVRRELGRNRGGNEARVCRPARGERHVLMGVSAILWAKARKQPVTQVPCISPAWH